MSRSYKKYPSVKARKSGKFTKKLYNKRIRRISTDIDLPKHRGFKKISNSWEIADYKLVEFKEDVIKQYYASQRDKLHNVDNFVNSYDNETLDEVLSEWKKFYKCK